MKRLTVIFCVLMIILSFCSCGKNNGEDTQNTDAGQTKVHFKAVNYTVKEKKYSEEFKNEEGEVTARLEMTYPEVECKERPDSAEEISSWFEEYKESEIESIRVNSSELARSKKDNGIEGVTVTRIACEVYYKGPFHVSFTIKSQSGINPDEDDGSLTGCTFSLADGYRLSLRSLYRSEVENPREDIKRLIQEEADISYSVRGNIALSDEQKAILDDLFDEENFCIKEQNIEFPYSFKTLSSGARSGFYFCPLDYNYAGDILLTPTEYYEQNYKD